jgi:hypothetical protein
MMLATLEERLGDSAAAERLCQDVLALQPGMADAQDCVRRNAAGGRQRPF